MSYDHAISHSSLEPLARRKINLSHSFIAKLKSIPCTRNHPLSQIVKNCPQNNDKAYSLQHQPINLPSANTDRFRNFITINDDYC